MPDDPARKREAAATFDEHAAAYVESAVHRDGDDLATLADWCADAERTLDVATGAGHTAGAVQDRGVPTVVAADAAPEMAATAVQKFPGICPVVADAERLPFRDGAFDAVTCRIAAHHFPDPETFVTEVARVLEPDGVFAFEDNIAPNDESTDAFLNRIERLRDPSHMRSHTEAAWRAWFDEAGFDIEAGMVVTKTIDYRDWIAQLDTPTENRQKIEALFSDPPEGAADLYEITHAEDGIASFVNLKVLLRARRC